MPKRTKRKTALPRVTLLAYSRRDLLAFVESVEQLRHAVADLTAIVSELKAVPLRVVKRTQRKDE